MKLHSNDSGDSGMQEMELIREVMMSGGSNTMLEDAADIMRLAQNPLLLHEHLQSLERGDFVLPIAVSDGRFEAQLQAYANGGCVYPAAGGMDTKANCYALRDKLFETSLKPEVFAASGEDREMAVDQVPCSSARSRDGITVPPNLIGGILIAFGVLLTAATVLDLLVMG